MSFVHAIGGPVAGTFEVPTGLSHLMWFPVNCSRADQSKYRYLGRRGQNGEYLFEHIALTAYLQHVRREVDDA